MISDSDKKSIIECAKKYKAKEVVLFGSSIYKRKSNDIDLAISGIRASLFFKFYGELMLRVSKSVDLIDLDRKTPFNAIIKKEGIKLYG